MDALLRASFSHRTASFWAWVSMFAVAGMATLWALAQIVSGGQEMAQDAFARGQRVLISITDGHITGTFLPSAVEPEETVAPAVSAPAEPLPAEPVAEPLAAPTTPAAEAPATPPIETAPPAAEPVPEEPKHLPTMPAARIPPREKPDVKTQDLAPPTGASPAEVKPTETKPDAAIPATEAKIETPATVLPTEASAAPAEKPAAPETVPVTPLAEAPRTIAQPSESITRPLPVAPLKKLTDVTADGSILPKTASDGTASLSAYAKPAPAGLADKSPRIAIVLLQIGLNQSVIEAAMNLPEDVSLSISPYAPKAASWLEMARVRGHEALLDLPMEPKEFPISDAGPLALSPREKPSENMDRLHQVLSSAQGYVGVVATPGEHFLSQQQLATATLEEIGSRGIFLISNNPRAAITLAQLRGRNRLSSLTSSLVLDGSSGKDALQKQLLAVEAAARQDGQVIALLRPTPLALQILSEWMPKTSAAGIAFVPASNLLSPSVKKAAE